MQQYYRGLATAIILRATMDYLNITDDSRRKVILKDLR